MDIRLIVPGNVRHGSGGNKYNAKLAEHLEALGAAVETVAVDGDWPVGSPADRQRFADALDGGTTVITDGLVASGVPDEVATAVGNGARVWILSHMALADHKALEGKALAAATGVICPSNHAAGELRARHGHPRIVIARPGTEAAGEASGSEPPHIIAVAAMLPNKQQTLIVEALASLRDLPWTAALIGSRDADPGYAAGVRAAVERHGLEGRLAVTGELSGTPLERQWLAADLSLLVSTSESFGMVVVESLAHGVPVLVKEGTGAVEALGSSGAGQAVKITGPSELAEAIRAWLTDESLRTEWRHAAMTARHTLPGWDATARTVLDALTTGA
ncbi:glycosyltransferase family 4 protein [Paenarthrobacter sp. NPDC018779]|uniref:glycosyltransferase family 4 protein n=1 Tax=Paenarthrobacter sp. NPDC018779 TaxID=3364375 RepID=UPI0037C935AE